MDRWEYKTEAQDWEQSVEELNSFGEQGWELVGVEVTIRKLPAEYRYRYIFKRKIN